MSILVSRLRKWGLRISKNKQTKKLSLCFLLVVLVGVFCIPYLVRAAEDLGTVAGYAMQPIVNALMLALANIFMAIAELFMKMAMFFLRFFIILAGYNGFIEANVVKFGWNIIRDVANMFFIIILLVIAFGTILGLEQYEWKKSLPKLIFAAIFVNFSNVICQLIIDVAQVFTITFLNAVAGIASGNFLQIMNFAGIGSFAQLSYDTANAGDIFYQLVASAAFAVFFTALAMGTIASYLIVMLYRVVVLWALMIISPLAFIFSILPSTKGYADEFWKEFINHVISAPVMVFFLWLAFATFGNGQVLENDIQGAKNNSLGNATLDEAGGPSPTAITLFEASTFSSMANSIVAIAFLLMGVERVQKLGVKGGDYIQKGLDFGKNVATIATGIRAAQWGKDKAWHGAKSGMAATAGFAAMNAPFIGGNSLKRKGKMIAGRVSNVKNKAQAWRDVNAAAIENVKEDRNGNKRSWYGKAAAATVGKFVSSTLLETGARKDKIAKTWSDAAEDSKKTWELKISTGSAAGGKEKLRQNRIKEQAEREDALKKEIKLAKTDQEMKNTDEKFGKGEDRIQDLNIEVAAIRQAKAIVENSAKELNHPEMVDAARKNSEKMAELNKKRDPKTGELTDKADQLAFKLAAEQMATLMTIAGNKGAEVLRDVMGKALSTVKFNEDINISDKDQAQRRFLSTQLGRHVTQGNTAKAFEDFRKLHGNNADNIIRNFDPAAKHAAQEGEGALVGIWDDSKTNKKGRAQYDLRGNEEADRKKFESTRKYYAQDVSPSKLTSVSGLINTEGDKMKIGDGETEASKKAMENLTIALGSMTYGTRVSDRLIDSLKQLQTDDKPGFDKWMEKFGKDRPQAEDALAIKMGIRADTRSSHSKRTEEPEGGRSPAQTTPNANPGTAPPNQNNNRSPAQPAAAAQGAPVKVKLDPGDIMKLRTDLQNMVRELRLMGDKESDDAKKLIKKIEENKKKLKDDNNVSAS